MTRPLLPRLLLLLLLSARTLHAEARPPDAITRDPATPLIRGDALLVRIEGLGGRLPEYREIVDSDGRIELPFLGMLPAAGKPLAEVEAEMTAAYAAAGLATNVTARLTDIARVEPPPDRDKLVRIQDPRRPVPTADVPLRTPEAFPPGMPAPAPTPPSTPPSAK